MSIKITGVGSYIPKIIQKNEAFQQHSFLNIDGSEIPSSNEVIVEKFKAITGISERRYAEDHLTASDLGALAAEKAIKDANIDPETLDYIILAHNFGPGWVEGVIQAQAYIKAGMAKRCLVIGAETLSRVVDPHDRDSMIYSDGAGATIIESSEDEGGILSHESASYTHDEVYHLFFGCSNNKSLEEDTRFIKMYGRKIYEFALSNVPAAMKTCLDNSGIDIKDVKKILIHQANEKMDEAIVNRFYRLYKTPVPEGIMPMSIHKLGNSSVATVPTLLDLIKSDQMEGHELHKGDVVIFASVGAGMHINAITYKY
jgi:3-oxoacyl-[acyl-carrier-protein] synthase-3